MKHPCQQLLCSSSKTLLERRGRETESWLLAGGDRASLAAFCRKISSSCSCAWQTSLLCHSLTLSRETSQKVYAKLPNLRLQRCKE